MAERLTEGTIRFVFTRIYSNHTNAMSAADMVNIRVIRGGKKKTHSPAFEQFETFVFKKLRDACAPCYLDFHWGSPRITRMQVRAAHPAKIRIIRGGKKKTHSSAFVKFEIFVFKKTPRFMRALLFRFLLGLPQPILIPNTIIPNSLNSCHPKKK